MVDLDELAGRARCASEWGRARMAVRVGGPIAVLTVVSLMVGSAHGFCVAGGALLFAVAAALRWWNQKGVDAVRVGLPLGAIPLVAGVALQRAGVQCGPLGSVSAGDVICLLAGATAGVGVTFWAARTGRDRRREWPNAVVIASLTAMLGCLGLGVASLLATLAALSMASAVAWAPVAARA
jgi:hypothetical protein